MESLFTREKEGVDIGSFVLILKKKKKTIGSFALILELMEEAKS